MGDEEKSKQENNQEHSGKNGPQTRQQTGGQYQLMQTPQYGGYSPADDEIDLADLAGVLFRRKWLIAGVTFVFACLAFAATSMITEKYNAATMLEIGMLLTDSGYEKVESSQAVKNRTASLAKAVAGKMSKELSAANDGEFSGLGFSVDKDLEIDAPDNGNIVSLALIAPKESKAITILSRTNQRLVGDHDRIFGQRRVELENRIARSELSVNNIDIQISKILNQIDELKRQYEEKEIQKENLIEKLSASIQNMLNRISELKREYEQKTGRQKNRIEELTSAIQNIESQKKFIQSKIKLLKQEQQDLELRIKEAETRYERLVDSKLAANDQVQGSDAVALMLFSSEVQHMQNYLSQLRDRLLLRIPETISELDTKIQELDTRITNLMADKSLELKRLEQLVPELNEKIEEFEDQIANLRSEKDLEQNRLAQLEPELKEKIEGLKGEIKNLESKKAEIGININELQSRLDNMIKTSVLVSPEFSDDPVSPNLKLNVALGFILGLFVAIFMAFIVEFWQSNKDKIRSGRR